MCKGSTSDLTTAYHRNKQLHVKYCNINNATIYIRLQFRLIHSPGQFFALCFTSENKITGLLLVTYKYWGEIIVKLKENKRKNMFYLYKMLRVRISSGNRFLLSLLVCLFVLLFFFLLSTLIVSVPRETVSAEISLRGQTSNFS